MNSKFSDIVKKIIDNNMYLTLATTDNSHPWASTVFFAADTDYNLYFVSYTNSVHVQNLLQNSHVAVTIFDSHQKAGTGEGVQIKGNAYEVVKEELSTVIPIIYERRFPDPKERFTKDLRVEKFCHQGKSVERIYKIIPEHFYMLDLREGGDERIEVSLR